MRFPVLFALCLPFALSGCSSMTTTAGPGTSAGAAIMGKVLGGQQPIIGAHIYLMAANTTGYGGPGIAPSTANASVSLLNPLITLKSDSVGAYVTTAADGSFTITGDYTCMTGAQVYLYALGGNAGAGVNTASGLLAVVGSCPALHIFPATQYVWMNEVSTIAAAYAFAGFASDATHVSSSGAALGQTGIANAFLNAANLVNPATGVALTITPAGTGTVPQTRINTLANILASCVNSTGATTGPSNATPCYTLFNNALFLGTAPTDTATAAINIAHTPSSAVSALYAIPPPAIAFAPALTGQPNDFTVGLQFPIPNYISSIAIDASGNVWIPSTNTTTFAIGVFKLSSTGALLSPAAGYSEPNAGFISDIAIDQSGDAWTTDASNGYLSKLSPAGANLVSVSTSYIGLLGIAFDAQANAWIAANNHCVPEFDNNGNSINGSKFGSFYAGYCDNVSGDGGLLSAANGVALDGAGNAWLPSGAGNTIVKIANSGTFLSGNSGITGNGLNHPTGVAINSAGSVWVANGSGNNILELNSSGSFITTSAGFTGGGLNNPSQLAIDGAGTVWVANSGAASVTGLSSSGSILSGVTGYQGAGLSGPNGIALDGSGNIWATNASCTCVSELVGTATPVITPIAAGLPVTPTADGSSKLGTRP
jgi:streptogramin lyase